MNFGILPGGLPFNRKIEHARLSSGGTSGGGGDRIAALSNNPSVASAAEVGVTSWKDGDDGGVSGDVGGGLEEDGEGIGPGPFTDTCLEMARLRLPQMELEFEENGFFGIDVRSLIIGREIARGAYGVVHEGKLLRSRPKDEGVDDGEQSGMYRTGLMPIALGVYLSVFGGTSIVVYAPLVNGVVGYALVATIVYRGFGLAAGSHALLASRCRV